LPLRPGDSTNGQAVAAPEAPGFNNLTKALSFNIYDVCYAVSEEDRQRYIAYIDEEYNADRLTQILTDVAEIIGANILNIARQDYDPQGASVTILISEQPVVDKAEAKGVISEAVVAHMDKSHITVHTYPETHPDNGIATSAPTSTSPPAA
jgi:S-adenosylmethionine decarboxylase